MTAETGGFTLRQLVDLASRALGWTNGDVGRATGLVEAYLRGREGREL